MDISFQSRSKLLCHHLGVLEQKGLNYLHDSVFYLLVVQNDHLHQNFYALQFQIFILSDLFSVCKIGSRIVLGQIEFLREISLT